VRDAVIIGAGIIGSSIALELHRRAIPAILLEKAVPGAESSSAAAGMLAPQLEADKHDAVFELGVLSRQLYPGYVETVERLSGLDVGYATDGAIQPARSGEELDALERRTAWQREWGHRVERLSRPELEAKVPGISGELRGGALFYPDQGQVDPRRLMRALSMATRRAGVEHISGTPVRRVLIRGGRTIGVELEDRVLATDRVVVAAGAWSSLIEGAAPRGSVRPARGQMIALDCGRAPFLPFVFAERGYLVPRRDGRVLVGATVELAGYEKAVTAGAMHELLSVAIETLPSLAAAKVVESWSGLRPWTQDRAPILGSGPVEGLYFATGHYRNGILQAPATAAIIADVIEGKKPPMDLAPFSVRRFT
jgi:glycine oxidase